MSQHTDDDRHEGGDSQDSVDLANELHTNRQRRFCDRATKLCANVRDVLVHNWDSYLEIIWNVVVVLSKGPWRGGVVRAAFCLVRRRGFCVVALFERVSLRSRLVLCGGSHFQILSRKEVNSGLIV